MDIVNILVALVLGALVYVVAAIFLPSPIPLLVALLVIIVGIFGGFSGVRRL